MKNIFLFLLLFTLFQTTFYSQEYFYFNGKVQTIDQNAHNSTSGKTIRYHPNGREISIYGKKPSPRGADISVSYYPNGQEKYLMNLLNGKAHGIFRSYYENGNIKSVGNYSFGYKDGEFFEYFKTGEIKTKYNSTIGEKRFFYKTGELWGVGYFDKNEKKIGEWKLYHRNKQLRQIGKYTNGNYTGEWIFYYVNGQVHQKRI